MSRKWSHEAENLPFHAYYIHFVMFNLHGRMFALIAVYLPNTWEAEETVDATYELLTLVLNNLPPQALVLIGGHFNAAVGSPQAGDNTSTLGCWK